MQNTPFKYQINDVVVFDQGDRKWDYKGEGKILLQNEYLLCNAYLVEMTDGTKIQVIEEQISEVK